MPSTTPRKPKPQPSRRITPRVKVWLEIEGDYVFGYGISQILEAIQQTGSIKHAAAELGKSYRHVWDRVKQAEQALGNPLVHTQVGGKDARRSELTAEAKQFLHGFLKMRAKMQALVDKEFARHFSASEAKKQSAK